jgi:hypothetical protein
MTLKLKFLSFVGLTATLALISSVGASPEASALDIYTHETTTIGIQENLQYGIGVSPGKIRDVDLTPGKRHEGLYRVYNEGKNDISIVIGISPFSYSADYENVNLMSSSSYNQIQEWIEIDRNPISLKAGEMKTIPFVITVPENARAGGQYFAFINRINPGSEPDEKGGMISGVKQIGLTVGTKIIGEDLNACGRVIDQKANFWQFSAPLVTTAVIENCGNVDFVAYGRLKIENALFGGGVIYETPGEKDIDIRVFPNGENTIREKDINWESAPIVGLFKVTQEVSIGDKVEVMTKTILILPLWILMIILIIILLIVLAIIIERKSRRKRRAGAK